MCACVCVSSHTCCHGTLQNRWPLRVCRPARPGQALPPAPTSATPFYDHEALAGPSQAPEGGLLPSASGWFFFLFVFFRGWGIEGRSGVRCENGWKEERRTGELQIKAPNVLCNKTHIYRKGWDNTHTHTPQHRVPLNCSLCFLHSSYCQKYLCNTSVLK